MTRKRLLYVAYLAPPMGGSRAQRVAAFSQELERAGWQVDILTIEPGPGYTRRDESLLLEGSPFLSQIRTAPGFLHKRAFRRKDTTQRQSGPSTGKRKFASWLIDRCLLPDRHLDWLPHALTIGKNLLAAHDYAAVLTSAAPFSGCLVGRFLAARAQRPLILDLGDPWTGRNGTVGVRRWLDRRMESWVLGKTDALIVTTQATKDHYGKMFPEFASRKIEIIPNGFWESDFAEIKNSEISERARTVVYSGTIYGHRVGLKNFMDAFQEVRKDRIARGKTELEFVFLGRDYLEFGESVGAMPGVVAKGFVDAQAACRVMGAASLLLLLGSDGGLQIPGKLWNYIGAGRPILTIPGREDEELRSLMVKLTRGPVITNDRRSIRNALENTLEAVDGGNERSRFSLESMADASWKSRAAKMDSLIHRVVASEKPHARRVFS